MEWKDVKKGDIVEIEIGHKNPFICISHVVSTEGDIYLDDLDSGDGIIDHWQVGKGVNTKLSKILTKVTTLSPIKTLAKEYPEYFI